MVDYLPSGSVLGSLLRLSLDEGFTKDLDMQMSSLYKVLV